ncbi:MAG: hypothetical protein IKW06_02565 [Clostridia bacterium]|nr:hypothetical protein [Clostridia bacterium]
MEISTYKGMVVFKTEFNEKFDLLQYFRAIDMEDITYHAATDFKAAGLQRKGHMDIWHMDIALAVSTDECPPQQLNKNYMGGNHGAPFCVCVQSGDICEEDYEIGSVWLDDEGTKWMLLKTFNNALVFISENLGTKTNFQFKKKITGKLTAYKNTKNVEAICDFKQSLYDYTPIIRMKKKQLVATMADGTELYNTSVSDCVEGRIEEEYDVLNPASFFDASTDEYKKDGEAIINCKICYRILNDGTITCEFENNLLQDVNYSMCMGLMFQEKCNSFMGGVCRYIPKTLPFESGGYQYDCRKPHDYAVQPFPDLNLTPEYWENPLMPPDRVVDYFKDLNNDNVAGFAGGYLPVYDGVGEVRKDNLRYSNMVVETNKAYPIFANLEFMKHTHGVGYRKYFDCRKNNSSLYTIDYDGATYYYIDFFAKDSLTIDVKGKQFCVVEKSENIASSEQNGVLTVSGDMGYFVLKVMQA